MKEITLTQGYVAKVDDADFEWLNQHSWSVQHGHNGVNYAVSAVKQSDGKYKRIKMHRMILGAEVGELVDHDDFDGLNNQRYNIKIVDEFESSSHRRKIKQPSQRPTKSWSGFMGVCFSDSRKQYVTYFKKRTVGYFDTPEEAAKAYDREAVRKFGISAITNFTQEIIQ